MNKDGTLNEECLKFKGMDRFVARDEVIKYLFDKKLYIFCFIYKYL